MDTNILFEMYEAHRDISNHFKSFFQIPGSKLFKKWNVHRRDQSVSGTLCTCWAVHVETVSVSTRI